MSGIKFWKGDENNRPGFTKFWVVACILNFLVHRNYFYIWDETFFFLSIGRTGYKNLSFYTYFKNVHLTLVKVHPKKFCLKNRFFRDFAHLSIDKKVFWLKLFLGALFTKIKFTFLKSVWKDGFFDTPFAILEGKTFHLRERTMKLFENLKVKYARNQSIFRKTFFYKQVLYFHRPFEIICHTSKLLNLIKT
jgi:hypothetical protein